MKKTDILNEAKKILQETAKYEKYAVINDDILKKFMALKKNNPTWKNCENRKTLQYHATIQLGKTIVETKLQPQQHQNKNIIENWEKSQSIDELNSTISSCRLCRLGNSRTNFVFGEGNPNAELMFIGEGPGRDEDLQGRPFVGRAGQLLDKMIVAMQFSRQEVYIANVVKCRPPENRVPEKDEAETCLPFLMQQISLIKPKAIVLLGATPSKYLLNAKSINEVKGKWHNINGIKTMPTYHPAFLLRNPPAKKTVWEDLKLVMAFLGKKIP